MTQLSVTTPAPTPAEMSSAADEKAPDTAEKPVTTSSDSPAAEDAAPKWVEAYESTLTKLPPALAARLPSSSAAMRSVAVAQDKLGGLGDASKQQWESASKYTAAKAAALREAASKKSSEARVEWMKQAWSVTNETQLPLNISLNQVGPLYFEVVAPGDTFERRIPNVWHLLEVRPYTSKATAYNAWSTTWPILCTAGPVVAATSLIAIPIVAVATGGSALASLSAFGSSISAAVSSATAGAVEGVTATAATVTAAAAKASRLPGAGQVKGKLADAAKSMVREQVGKQEVQQRVIRYLTKSGTVTPHGDEYGAKAIGAGVGADAPPLDLEGDVVQTRDSTGKKLDEVDVTGYDMEKVLACETGHSSTDKALTKAFKRLSFKTKFGEFKAQDNPVLRIVGGPELETRPAEPSLFKPNPPPRQILIFHPFLLIRRNDVVAEPISPEEVPPTENESRVIEEAKVVETYAEAEKAVKKTEQGESPEQAVEEALAEAHTDGTDIVTPEQAHEGDAPTNEATDAKKGWFGWR